MKKSISILTITLLMLGSTTVFAQRYMENLNRGTIAVRSSASNVLVSWRLLGNDPDSVAFNLYYNNAKLNTNPIIGATNYTHSTSDNGQYYVKPIVKGVEQAATDTAETWTTNYKEISLNVPAGGVTPSGGSYSYRPNDASAGDMDGDGEYEIFLKWDPSNAQDNSKSGYTGNVYIDAYKLDGSFLWRIDLGINIRAGAHYTQFMVYDFNNDGIVELACKTAPGTKDGKGNFLSTGPAASDNDAADYRKTNGYVLSGPEYLTIFNGATGEELSTIYYTPRRHPDTENPTGSQLDAIWGDDYGNRVDRFLAGVAYLDGIHPSLVMCRGYYTRTVLAAYDWNGTTLSQRWVFDSRNGKPNYEHQGNHSLSIADVDNDGKDEIIYGSCTIDHDGTGLYTTGLQHGDALHVSDLDPDHPGLEVFMPHENKRDGVTFRDGATGEILWQHKSNTDVGRGLAADVLPTYRGSECWASSGLGMYNNKGNYVGSMPSINFAIWWDSDDLRELLDGTQITKYGEGTLLSATNCNSNNGTKSTPCLQADLFGDWREEVIWRTSDNSKLRIYSTTSSTDRRMYTLMHDPVYRMAIAWQNGAYNQPPHTGFHFGNEMQEPPASPIRNNKTVWNAGSDWDINTSSNWTLNEVSSVYTDGSDVIFDLEGDNASAIQITENVAPASVLLNSPNDYTFNGSGELTGIMNLNKIGSGTLTIENNHTYSGITNIWNGTLQLNGTLTNSRVIIYKHAKLSGVGSPYQLTINDHGMLHIGAEAPIADTLQVGNQINLLDGSVSYFDLSDDTTSLTNANDIIMVNGDVNLHGHPIIEINLLNDSLSLGTYPLIQYTGTLSGNFDSLIIKGIEGTPFELMNNNKVLSLKILPQRKAGLITWVGGDNNNTWDLTVTYNWSLNNQQIPFIEEDSVLIDDSGKANNTIIVVDEISPAHTHINSSSNYTLTGDGAITGNGGLTKHGAGKLTIENTNTYTGTTRIAGGTLEVSAIEHAGVAGPLGKADNAGEHLIINGGTLSLTAVSALSNRNITIGNSGATFDIDVQKTSGFNGILSGDGELTKSGYGVLNLYATNTYTGGTKLKQGEIYLGSENATKGGVGAGVVTIESGTLRMFNSTKETIAPWDINVPASAQATILLDKVCTLTGSLIGSGELSLYTTGDDVKLTGDWSGFDGNILVSSDANGGKLILGNSAGLKSSAISLGNNTELIYLNNSNDTITIGELTGSALSVLGAGGTSTNTITWKLGTLGTSFTFNGEITNAQYSGSGATTSVIKSGNGILTLTNANTYTGSTNVEAGMLEIDNTTGSATGTGDVTIHAGGTLLGDGTAEGNVYNTFNGVVSPGKENIGELTIGNNFYLDQGSYYLADINTDALTGDVLTVNDTAFINGILYLTPSGTRTLEIGDSIKILNATTCVGNFASINPIKTPGGIDWNISTLETDGFLRVGVYTAPVHTISTKQLSDFNLFPNPGNDEVFIEINSPSANVTTKLETIDGSLISQTTHNNSTKKIRLAISTLPNGIYFLTVQTNKYKHTQKLIIQH